MRFPVATPAGFVIVSGEPYCAAGAARGADDRDRVDHVGVGSELSSSRRARKRDDPRRSSDQCVPCGVTSRPAASKTTGGSTRKPARAPAVVRDRDPSASSRGTDFDSRAATARCADRLAAGRSGTPPSAAPQRRSTRGRTGSDARRPRHGGPGSRAGTGRGQLQRRAVMANGDTSTGDRDAGQVVPAAIEQEARIIRAERA